MPDHTETRTLDEMGRMVTTSGDDYGMNLVEAVRMWPTPTNNGNHNRKGLSKTSGDGLATAVAMIGTSTTNDAKNSTLPKSQRLRESLVGDLRRAGEVGQLNPDWVEALMGFPPGWTADAGGRTGKPVCPAPLPPDNSSDAPDCEPSETR